MYFKLIKKALFHNEIVRRFEITNLNYLQPIPNYINPNDIQNPPSKIYDTSRMYYPKTFNTFRKTFSKKYTNFKVKTLYYDREVRREIHSELFS